MLREIRPLKTRRLDSPVTCGKTKHCKALFILFVLPYSGRKILFYPFFPFHFIIFPKKLVCFLILDRIWVDPFWKGRFGGIERCRKRRHQVILCKKKYIFKKQEKWQQPKLYMLLLQPRCSAPSFAIIWRMGLFITQSS